MCVCFLTTSHISLIFFFTGFIKIEAPAMIGYNTSAKVKCTTPLGTLDDVKWYIQKDTNIQRITNGTEATVSMDLLTSIVYITHTSEVWKGWLFPTE